MNNSLVSHHTEVFPSFEGVGEGYQSYLLLVWLGFLFLFSFSMLHCSLSTSEVFFHRNLLPDIELTFSSDPLVCELIHIIFPKGSGSEQWKAADTV